MYTSGTVVLEGEKVLLPQLYLLFILKVVTTGFFNCLRKNCSLPAVGGPHAVLKARPCGSRRSSHNLQNFLFSFLMLTVKNNHYNGRWNSLIFSV